MDVSGRPNRGCGVVMKETDIERELRLAKQDIDNPRPQFWAVDLERYKAAKLALESKGKRTRSA